MPKKKKGLGQKSKRRIGPFKKRRGERLISAASFPFEVRQCTQLVTISIMTAVYIIIIQESILSNCIECLSLMTLPPNWFVNTDCEEEIKIFCVTRHSSLKDDPLVISRSLIIYRDCFWSCHINSQKVNPHCSAMSEIPKR